MHPRYTPIQTVLACHWLKLYSSSRCLTSLLQNVWSWFAHKETTEHVGISESTMLLLAACSSGCLVLYSLCLGLIIIHMCTSFTFPVCFAVTVTEFATQITAIEFRLSYIAKLKWSKALALQNINGENMKDHCISSWLILVSHIPWQFYLILCS